jgi:hypothetical protein
VPASSGNWASFMVKLCDVMMVLGMEATTRCNWQSGGIFRGILSILILLP